MPIPATISPFDISIIPAGKKISGEPNNGIMLKNAPITPQKKGSGIPNIQNPKPKSAP